MKLAFFFFHGKLKFCVFRYSPIQRTMPRELFSGVYWCILKTRNPNYYCSVSYSKILKPASTLDNRKIHLTCIAHVMHCVGKCVWLFFLQVAVLAASTKLMFLISLSRLAAFRITACDILLPPLPALARWGT